MAGSIPPPATNQIVIMCQKISTPDVVLFTDHTEVLYLQKTLGAFKIASELRAAGFSVQVVSHLHTFSVDEIKKIISCVVGTNTLFVGFSSFFYKQCEDPVHLDKHPHEKGGIKYKIIPPGALIPHGSKYNSEIRSLIKTLNPACRLVLGGPDAKDASHVSVYDYVVLGYADIVVVNLAQHLAHNTPLSKHQRSVFGPVIIDGGRAEGYNFVGASMRYHDSDIVLPGETLATEISRGCIFRCKFCAYPLNGKKKNDHIKLEQVLINEFIEN